MKKTLLLLVACFTIIGMQAQKKDWPQLERYAQANKEVIENGNPKDRVVFLGNSITQNWAKMRPEFFSENNYVGRGISGQTSYQFIVRFRQDVINLNPELVVINVGTNDVAENTCPYDEEATLGNIISMVELAKANKIKVILTSVLPADHFYWRKEVGDVVQKICKLNERIKAYAKKQRIPFVDYYTPMVTDGGAIHPTYSTDGVHPTIEGYEVMEPLIKQAIQKAL